MTTVTIERLGHQGDGIAPGPVYVPRMLPGEVVEGEISGDRISAPKIITPSSDRVKPACRHYAQCGGCSLQHASDDFVANWKAGVVREALMARGLGAEISAVHTSPAKSRRRAVLTGKRTKKGAMVGFHGAASHVIVDVLDCQILQPAIASLLPELRRLTVEFASRKGELRFVITSSDTGIDLLISGGKELDLAMRGRLAELSEQMDLARLVWEDEVIAQRRPPILNIGSAPVPLAPGGFLQATREGQTALQAAVMQTVNDARSVVDLFSGCGTFALVAAEKAEVHAVDSVDDLLAALDAGWRHGTGLKQITTENRDLFRRPMLSDELAKFDVAIIDPPRAGAEAQVVELASSKIPTVASVSCNPVTFARDAEILVKAGYAISNVQVVDQFRWSPHVEVTACFSLQ
ncbi:MAG: class I SAM-dependent RNA methyltransferase [Boseongicola sp.]|nr:class I SAM-dependent RNA methyltransferase [Boseongicola sp.]MDD9978492.1 class I SAM-dependent RNA methyltransferase [Boseongicola sp.]